MTAEVATFLVRAICVACILGIAYLAAQVARANRKARKAVEAARLRDALSPTQRLWSIDATINARPGAALFAVGHVARPGDYMNARASGYMGADRRTHADRRTGDTGPCR